MARYVFGYGTLINNESRRSTLLSVSSSETESNGPSVLCELSGRAGLERAWCFRSATGFTALGLRESSLGLDVTLPGIKGVAFQVSERQLVELDKRERGYYRKEVAFEHLLVEAHSSISICEGKVFVYIPETSEMAEPTEGYPILQTYIDCCLSGCISWGGEELMREFIATTSAWSVYYLNDPIMSRRPWLHRPHWQAIDTALGAHGDHTKFSSRKHTEEYLGAFHSLAAALTLRGMWGFPARNRYFVGRDEQLDSLLVALQSHGLAQICGLGGMGKSSLATEFVHRHFGENYDLALFIHGESRASIAGDFRKFARDMMLLPASGAGAGAGAGTEASASGSISPSGASGAPAGSGSISGTSEIDDNAVVDLVRRHLAKVRTSLHRPACPTSSLSLLPLPLPSPLTSPHNLAVPLFLYCRA